MKGWGVGAQVISGVGNEARVVVNDDAQGGGNGLGISRRVQRGARGKVGHPEVIDLRSLEALGGPAQRLAQLWTTGCGVELMLSEQPIDRVE